MSRSDREVLFVSHEANRTGAPLVLLRLLEWIKTNTDLGFQVLLLRTGPLKEEFEALSRVVTLEKRRGQWVLPSMERELLRRGLTRSSWIVRQIARAQLFRHARFPLLYLNSAGSIPLLSYVPDRAERVIAHVHELSTAMRLSIPPHLWGHRGKCPLMNRVDRFIAVAECVKDDLVNEYSIPPNRVAVHHSFIDPASIDSAGHVNSASDLRRQLGIPDHAQVVVGSGSLEWRKGPDLFIQLGRLLTGRNTRRPVHLLWVGGEIDDPHYRLFAHDLKQSGAAERVHFVPSTEHRFDYFGLGDVFVLTSREDPFPLVCLEASLLGLPVVSFENGGMREFLDESCLVPYFDVAGMADKVEALLADERARKLLADESVTKVLRDHDVNVRAPAIYEEIDRLLTSTAQHA